ncbi:MAG: hypothetical protein ACI8Z1_003849, partial [Candidatus Azotimanducaceae bacterium]
MSLFLYEGANLLTTIDPLVGILSGSRAGSMIIAL